MYYYLCKKDIVCSSGTPASNFGNIHLLMLINLLSSLEDFKVKAIGKEHISIWDICNISMVMCMARNIWSLLLWYVQAIAYGTQYGLYYPLLNTCKEGMVTLSGRGTSLYIWRSNCICFISYTLRCHLLLIWHLFWTYQKIFEKGGYEIYIRDILLCTRSFQN